MQTVKGANYNRPGRGVKPGSAMRELPENDMPSNDLNFNSKQYPILPITVLLNGKISEEGE